jgi:hypothetical protein
MESSSFEQEEEEQIPCFVGSVLSCLLVRPAFHLQSLDSFMCSASVDAK